MTEMALIFAGFLCGSFFMFLFVSYAINHFKCFYGAEYSNGYKNVIVTDITKDSIYFKEIGGEKEQRMDRKDFVLQFTHK